MITVSFVVQLVAALFLLTLANIISVEKANFLGKICWKLVPTIIAVALTLSAFKVF